MTRRLIARFCRFFQLRYLTVVFRCPAFVISGLLLLLTRRRASRVAVDDRLRRARECLLSRKRRCHAASKLVTTSSARRPTDRTNERVRYPTEQPVGPLPPLILDGVVTAATTTQAHDDRKRRWLAGWRCESTAAAARDLHATVGCSGASP